MQQVVDFVLSADLLMFVFADILKVKFFWNCLIILFVMLHTNLSFQVPVTNALVEF